MVEEVILTAPLKQVGNSLCIFIPAGIRDELSLTAKEEITIRINKKKDKKTILSLFGATKGKLGPWVEKEDRLDVRD
jgi:hypothetical protein